MPTVQFGLISTEPVTGMFTNANFPGASAADLTQAQNLYSIVTGRISQITGLAGKENKILCTTMGAATDMKHEAMRRLVVNAVYAYTGLEVPEKANVDIVGEFAGSFYGFGGAVKGKKPADYK